MNFDLNQEKIQVIKDGKIVECDVLFTFRSDDTEKSYVAYTDYTIASNGRKNIYISSFNPFKEVMELEDISDSKELDMIHAVLQQLDSTVSN